MKRQGTLRIVLDTFEVRQAVHLSHGSLPEGKYVRLKVEDSGRGIEMTGTELAGAIHERRPDLPIVLMTGYGGDLRPDHLQTAGIREVLKKPLLSRPLTECLSRQLGLGAPVSTVTNHSLSEIKG